MSEIFYFLSYIGTIVIGGGLVAAVLFFLLRTFLKASVEEGVKLGFSKALEDHKANLLREIEVMKTSLKFTESRFSKQYEALVALRAYFRKALPRKGTPDMDWHEAMEELAIASADKMDGLEGFLCLHEAVLPGEVLTLLEQALQKADDCRFEIRGDASHLEATTEGIELAQGFWDDLAKAVQLLQAVIDKQMPERGNR